MKTLFAAIVAASLFSMPALAAEFEVKMLNKGSDGEIMVFEPAAVKAAPGDVIVFIPVDKGHDAALSAGMVPEGVELQRGKMNQEFRLTVTTEGAYVIKCSPHLGMGMVALIVVGDAPPANLDAVRTGKLPKKARERLDAQIVSLGL